MDDFNRKIGEVFQYGEIKLVVVEDKIGTCYGCYFHNNWIDEPLLCEESKGVARDKSTTGSCIVMPKNPYSSYPLKFLIFKLAENGI